MADSLEKQKKLKAEKDEAERLKAEAAEAKKAQIAELQRMSRAATKTCVKKTFEPKLAWGADATKFDEQREKAMRDEIAEQKRLKRNP